MSIFIYALRATFLAFLGISLLALSLSAQPGGDRATSIKPGEPCPLGMTEIRPRSCMAPARSEAFMQNCAAKAREAEVLSIRPHPSD